MRRAFAFVISVGLLAWGCGDEAFTTTSTRVATSAATTASTATTSEPVIPFGEDLQRVLDGVLDADDAMGFSLAVMVPGYQPWLGVVGESEPGVPITTGMALGAGSTSKNFIAALVLQLAEEGKLRHRRR